MVKLIKNPMLSEVNRDKRINFAKNFSQNPPEFWNQVIWSDKTTVRSNPNSKEIFIKVHNSVKRKNLPFNTKSQNQGMFWGCSPEQIVDGTLNADNYKRRSFIT